MVSLGGGLHGRESSFVKTTASFGNNPRYYGDCHNVMANKGYRTSFLIADCSTVKAAFVCRARPLLRQALNRRYRGSPDSGAGSPVVM